MARLRGNRTPNVQGKKGDKTCNGARGNLTSTNRGRKVQPRCTGQALARDSRGRFTRK